MINLSTYSYDGEWRQYADGVRFKVRPFPASLNQYTFSSIGEVVLKAEQFFKKFDYCVTEWEGVGDDTGVLPCTTSNKKRLFDGYPLVATYIMTIIDELDKRGENAEKNSGTSPGGL